MDKYLNEFMADLPAFGEKIAQFDKGEITVAQYKGFSGGYGSYAQKGAKKHMLRLRISGGRINKEKLLSICNMCEKYDVDMAKFTTCESVQLHNLPAEKVDKLMKDAWESGFITRGGGGDFPRNVMCSPLTGLTKEEPFDVYPYAEAAAEYLLGFIKGPKFPRKLKVCFLNDKNNSVHATFRDLGFVANENGKFDVYSAGGLGNGPLLGVQVASDVEPEKILYYIKAMVNLFLLHGNYENRGKARTRFMKEKLGGDEAYVAEYNRILNEVFASESLDISVKPVEIKKSGDGSIAEGFRVFAQKQDGLFSVWYHPVSGQVNPAKFREIYETVKDMDEVELRLAPDSSVYIVNLTGAEAEKVLAVTDDGANTSFEASVCCVGPVTCQGGVSDSPALVKAMVEAAREAGFAEGVLPKISVSGCPSSCAAHQTAPIGFRGAMKNKKQAFAVFVGGSAEKGKEKIAEAGKVILAGEIPQMMVEIGREVEKNGGNYFDWYAANSAKLDEIIEKYSEIE